VSVKVAPWVCGTRLWGIVLGAWEGMMGLWILGVESGSGVAFVGVV
jgi:hypothetical protein